MSRIKSRNSTAKTTMAVVREATKVPIEIPSLFFPLPPACSSAEPRSVIVEKQRAPLGSSKQVVVVVAYGCKEPPER